MSKNIKSISNPKLKLEILTAEEVKKIHEATLWIIEHVGVRVRAAPPGPAGNACHLPDGARRQIYPGEERIRALVHQGPPLGQLRARLPRRLKSVPALTGIYELRKLQLAALAALTARDQ